MKKVLLPLDGLTELWPDEFRGARVGAVLHPASVSSSLKHAATVLHQADPTLLRLTTLFGPQHGFFGQTQDNMIEWQSFEHPRFRVPVYSLYGESREPNPEMLQGLDLLVIDLQDVGARYYTFIWTMYLCLRVCARLGLPVIVLDRPNPINGLTTEGPILNPEYSSFVGLHPLPVRHGQTIGELAELFRREAFPNLKLTVLPMKNWERAMWFDQTGLPWVMPSPNMPTLDSATVYPGMCLLEGTNISEGRGTTRPFEVFGAPFIEPERLTRELNAQRLPGVHFRPVWFQPGFQKFAGELCGGAQLHVVERDLFPPFATGLEVIRTIRRLHANSFMWKQPPYEYEYHRLPIEILLGRAIGNFFGD
jgi:uncharacterized protein YbbC (DUF1343 family)